MSEVALSVQGLFKRYPGASIDAVSDLTFTLPKGCICGFIGPNGAGKTTTMRICSTLELPDAGNAYIGGYSILSHPDEVRRQIGFMPDLFPVPPEFPVGEMLEFFGRAHGLWGPKLRQMSDSVIDFTNLSSMLEKPFGALSKGMKQRAALATVLMHDPNLLILDEPAAGLDPRARVELRTLLTLLAEQGKTVLISSHILAELSEICDRAVVIEQGKMRAERTLKDGKVVADFVERSEAVESSLVTPLYLETLAHPEMVLKVLEQYPFIQASRLHEEGVLMSFAGDREAQADFLKVLVDQGIQPVRFAEQAVNLEDLFLSLTEGNVQ